MSAEDKWRVEAITATVEDALATAEGNTPAAWFAYALGQIAVILDMTDEEVQNAMRQGEILSDGDTGGVP